jgi:hypothetical protein
MWEALLVKIESGYGAAAAGEIEGHRGPVPVSQYSAVPSLIPGEVVGFSLYSLLGGIGLGVRTKALALHCYGCDTQMGVSQYNNPALRTHCAFGPLEIIQPVAWAHDLATETFVYRLDVRGVDLESLSLHGRVGSVSGLVEEGIVRVALGDETYVAVQALMDSHGRVQVAPPGHESGELLLRLA